MTKEYISREDVCLQLGKQESIDGQPRAIRRARRIVAEFPAADVVEVVRCRDCVYWRGENDICKGICIDFSADGYCSEGKRKDGGQDGV